MKKIFFLLGLLAVVSGSVSAQEFQGMAVYEAKTSTSEMQKQFMGDRQISPEQQKMIDERMKSVFEKTFILNFDKSASIYKEEEKLDAPGQSTQQQGGMRMMTGLLGGGGTQYKNIKDKVFIVDKEFMSKEFLVKDSLPKLDWKLEGESRKIGDYTCYKATAVRAVSQSDIRNLRPRMQAENAKKAATASDEKKSNILDQVELPKEVTITAWYTPDIPVSQGPENYWGLPGLILEVNDGKTIILCSKVVLNTKDKAAIKAPTNGKVVTQKEYDEIVVAKMNELKQMYQNGGGNRTMRIGG